MELLALLAAVLAAPVARAERTIRRMPWHLIDVWWDLGAERPFETYSIDVTFSEDPPESTRLYVAPAGRGELGSVMFYDGLQTQSDGKTREQPRLHGIGRGLIFSAWGERRLEAIRPGPGGVYESSGHEGDFISVRTPYRWTKGTYTYRLVRLEREVVDGKPCTWVGAFVTSHARNETIFIGALRFPGEHLVLKRQIASFVEIYGAVIPYEEIPKLTVRFDNLKVNGEPVAAGAIAIYPQDVPDYAAARARDGGLDIEVGSPVTNRTQRQVRLLPAGP